MPEVEVPDELLNALSLYPQNPQAAIDQSRPLADAGNLVAQGALAWMLAQQGRPTEGMDYALAAAQAGAGQLANQYGQNLVTNADPAARDRAAEFLQLAQRFPSVLDPFGTAQNAIQQGNQEVARDVLANAFTPPLGDLSKEADRILDDARSRLKDIGSKQSQVDAEAQGVTQAMHDALEGIRREEGELRKTARQVGALASQSSAILQAREYSDRADRIEKRGELLTYASLALAVLIAAAAIGLGASVVHESSITAIARRAALSLPLVFVNIYLARLAASFRNEALRWRHIELQLKSVVPYLGGIDAGMRGNVLAALAAGFFPGQALPTDDHEAGVADKGAVMAAALEDRAGRIDVSARSSQADQSTQPISNQELK